MCAETTEAQEDVDWAVLNEIVSGFSKMRIMDVQSNPNSSNRISNLAHINVLLGTNKDTSNEREVIVRYETPFSVMQQAER